jgi:ribosomal protein L19
MDQKILFKVGDVLGLSVRNRGHIFFFEGLCIALYGKLFSVEASFILRNVLANVGIEILVSYYYNRVFLFKIQNFKRKKADYLRAKLYYLREKGSHSSRIK